jgi:hypothetical protein
MKILALLIFYLFIVYYLFVEVVPVDGRNEDAIVTKADNKLPSTCCILYIFFNKYTY